MKEFKIPCGAEVKDRVSGFTGIVTARHDYMWGCVMYSVQPQELHEGQPVENRAFDEARLEVLALPKEGAFSAEDPMQEYWATKSVENTATPSPEPAPAPRPTGGPERHRPGRP